MPTDPAPPKPQSCSLPPPQLALGRKRKRPRLSMTPGVMWHQGYLEQNDTKLNQRQVVQMENLEIGHFKAK